MRRWDGISVSVPLGGRTGLVGDDQRRRGRRRGGRRLVGLASYQGYRPARSQLLLQRSLQAAPLIGRQAELAAVLELLEDPSVRLVTLTGRSGVGKTRLALEVGWARDVARPGSVGMVSLANVQEPGLVVAEMAAQLEVPTLPGQPLAAALIRWLDRFPLVLLVDNFEHILAARRALDRLTRRLRTAKTAGHQPDSRCVCGPNGCYG